jgi:hypothetical protein
LSGRINTDSAEQTATKKIIGLDLGKDNSGACTLFAIKLAQVAHRGALFPAGA